jgi:bacteriocin-like protein
MTTQNPTRETAPGSVLTNVVAITTTKRDDIELTEEDLQRVTGGIAQGGWD